MILSPSKYPSSQQILQKLFIPCSQNKPLKLNLKLLKQISEDNNYKNAIQLIMILERVLETGNRKMSIRQLLTKSANNFVNFRTTSSGFNLRKDDSPLKIDRTKNDDNSLKIDKSKKDDSPLKMDKITSSQIKTQNQQPIFMSQELSKQQKTMLIGCLQKICENLQNTIYQNKISYIIQNLLSNGNSNKLLKQKSFEQQLSKRMLKQLRLDMDVKSSLIQVFLTKDFSLLQSKFPSFLSLYTFLAYEILPLIQRKILSIPISNHSQRQQFLLKVVKFLAENYLQQFVIEIKINKATLIENRVFVSKLYKDNLRKHQRMIMTPSLMTILNQALLCPSNIKIQEHLFRILKRMYYLWGSTAQITSNRFIDSTDDSLHRLGNFIKYPLFVNLKNISLYSSLGGQEQVLKQVAMFSYKTMHQKYDLQLSNLLQTCDQLRFLKDCRYFSSKAYAFSQQISCIYDTFDLQLKSFWHYHKHFNKGQMFQFNVLVERPNSLLIWQFWLCAHDIRFGIYKVDGFNKHTIDDYNKQNDCKQILKIDKYIALQATPHKGFVFLKNGLYKLVFDNTYSNFRGKDLSYMFLHLQSEN